MVSNLPKVTQHVIGRSDIPNARSASREDALNPYRVLPPTLKRRNPRHREVKNAISDKSPDLNSGFSDSTAQAVKDHTVATPGPGGGGGGGGSRIADPATPLKSTVRTV